MTRFFLPKTTAHLCVADLHRGDGVAWGGSEMHVRGCDCDECCPGVPAVATRVTTDPRRLFPRLMRRDDRDAGLEAQRKYYDANRAKEQARSREAMRALYWARSAGRAVSAEGARRDSR